MRPVIFPMDINRSSTTCSLSHWETNERTWMVTFRSALTIQEIRSYNTNQSNQEMSLSERPLPVAERRDWRRQPVAKYKRMHECLAAQYLLAILSWTLASSVRQRECSEHISVITESKSKVIEQVSIYRSISLLIITLHYGIFSSSWFTRRNNLLIYGNCGVFSNESSRLGGKIVIACLRHNTDKLAINILLITTTIIITITRDILR